MTTAAEGPRVALIHAVAVAIDPVREAFAALWPEARPFNLLEDALSPDSERDAELVTLDRVLGVHLASGKEDRDSDNSKDCNVDEAQARHRHMGD